MNSFSANLLQKQANATAGIPAVPYVQRFGYDGQGNIAYEGWAVPGTATSTAGWAIRRSTYVGGNCTAVEWAGGVTDMTQVWDNAAALTYK